MYQKLPELIAAFFAAATFLISCVVFFRQFIYRRDRVICAIEVVAIEGDGHLKVQISINNFGTHPIKLRDALIVRHLDGFFGFDPSNNSAPLIAPRVIPPLGIETLHVTWGDGLHQHPETQEAFADNYRGERQTGISFDVKLTFMAISGERLECSKHVATCYPRKFPGSGFQWELVGYITWQAKKDRAQIKLPEPLNQWMTEPFCALCGRTGKHEHGTVI